MDTDSATVAAKDCHKIPSRKKWPTLSDQVGRHCEREKADTRRQHRCFSSVIQAVRFSNPLVFLLLICFYDAIQSERITATDMLWVCGSHAVPNRDTGRPSYVAEVSCFLLSRLRRFVVGPSCSNQRNSPKDVAGCVELFRSRYRRPNSQREAPAGFEPAMEDLQSPALDHLATAPLAVRTALFLNDAETPES